MSVTPPPASSSDADLQPTTPLRLAVLEIEAHVSTAGWDQPPRLYALVRTADLIEREPALAEQLGAALAAEPEGLTTIEQEALDPERPLEDLLMDIEWPDAVFGCAVALERLMLPPGAEADLPDDPTALLEAAAAHPDRQEVRLLAAVTRDGQRHCAVRARTPDGAPLLEGPDLVPGLTEALAHTLTSSD